jgi:MFS family permease
VHTTVGFLGAFLGPLLFGLILDAAGGPKESGAWTKSFAISGGFTLLAGIFVRLLTRRVEVDQSF